MIWYYDNPLEWQSVLNTAHVVNFTFSHPITNPFGTGQVQFSALRLLSRTCVPRPSQRSLAISRGKHPDVDTSNTTRWFQSLWTKRATSRCQFHPTLWWVLYTSMSIPMHRMAVQLPRTNWMSVKDFLDIPIYSKMFQSPNESRMMVNDPNWVVFSSSNAWHPKRCDSGISGRFL